MNKKIRKFWNNPLLLLIALGHRGYFNWMSDRAYLKMIYFIKMGKRLDIDNPQTFNEKLQWMKLYDRNPEYTRMVDKYEAKRYVADVLGEEYVIPTLGVWNRPEDIDFDSLPNQYVLKTTHDSGGVILCHDNLSFEKGAAINKLSKCLKHNFYWGMREWPYKDVKPRIIAEKYMKEDKGTDLKDYKFFCFDGVVKMFKVDFDRFVCHRANYYDREGNFLPFGEVAYPFDKSKVIDIPPNFDRMVEFAEKLSKGIPFVRIDFYNVNGRIYFGEITFYPASGFGKLSSEEWDMTIGSWIKINNNKRSCIK